MTATTSLTIGSRVVRRSGGAGYVGMTGTVVELAATRARVKWDDRDVSARYLKPAGSTIEAGKRTWVTFTAVRPIVPEPTLADRFAATVPEFQAAIRDIAAKNGKTWEQVFGWWREYSAACWDQSATLPEFEDVVRRKVAA